MNTQNKSQNRVDQLIHHFWKNGYLTLSRRYGKYLPEPKPIGNYEIDAVGKYKKKVVLGVILKEDEFNDPQIISKLNYLATSHQKNRKIRLTLFVGVAPEYSNRARLLVKSLSPDAQKNIKVVQLKD